MSDNNNHGKTIPSALFGAGAWYAYNNYTGPAIISGAVQPAGAIALGITVLCAITVTANVAAFIARTLDWKRKTLSKSHKAKSRWATLRECRRDLVRHPVPAPYWGVYQKNVFSRKLPVFSDFCSNAVTFGSAGSGKGVAVVLNNILAVRASKVVLSLKGTEICIIAPALKKRGERVVIINLGDSGLPHVQDLFPDTDRLNPLDMIVYSFTTKGELTDVTGLALEIATWLLPEPEGGGNDKYWRDGARDCIVFTAIYTVIIKGGRASLGDILEALSNRDTLLKDALFCAGKSANADGQRMPGLPFEDLPWFNLHDPSDAENFAQFFRNKADSTAQLLASKENKTAESFISAAILALGSYSIAAKPIKAMKNSTFNPAILKDDPDSPVTVFIAVDSSKPSEQLPAAGILMNTLLNALKRHKNKHVPVYMFLDEISNFKIDKLPSLLTWGREYGIRNWMFIQSLSAFRQTYGAEGLATMLSETEIKQFLPNLRCNEISELIEKMLGSESYIARSYNKGGDGKAGQSVSEDTKPLLTLEEVRRFKRGILFIKQNRPLKVSLPSIAAIHPWRNMQEINPFYGKTYLRRVTLRIRPRNGTLTQRLRRAHKKRNPIKGGAPGT